MKITDTLQKIEDISTDELKKWLQKTKEGELTLLDVRQPEEYEEGHLPGATLIPLPELMDRIKEVDSSKPVITYCRMGIRGRAAASLLMREGFKEAYNIAGGISAWKGQVATGAYEEGMFLLEGRKTIEELISLAWVLEDGSRSFYERAGEIVHDREAKQVFDHLVKAEEQHKATILDTYKKIKGRDVTEFLQEESLKGFMEGGVSIEETVEWLKSEERSLLDILEVSMQIETNSLDLYIKILHEMEDEDSRKIFYAILSEEKAHLARLGSLIGNKHVNE